MPAIDYVESLIGFIEDIKPYHTKIFGVGVEYRVEDLVNVVLDESLLLEEKLGTTITEILLDSPYLITDELSVPENRQGIVVSIGGGPDWPLPTVQYNLPTGFMEIISVSLQEQMVVDGQNIPLDHETESIANIIAASTICECVIILDGVGFDAEVGGFDSYDYDSVVEVRRFDSECRDNYWDYNGWDAYKWDETYQNASSGRVVFGNQDRPNLPSGTEPFAYLHTQVVLSTVWTINHGMDNYPLAIRTFDGGGTEIPHDNVFHINREESSVTFSAPVTGEARVYGAVPTAQFPGPLKCGPDEQLPVIIPSPPAVNIAPIISNTGAVVGYINGDGATNIDSITIVDIDNTTIQSAIVSFSSGFVNTEDELVFVNVGNIVGSFNNTNGILTLTGTDSVSAYESALSSVQYINNELTNPNTTTRTISWTVNDGTVDSNIITNTISVTVVVVIGPPQHNQTLINPNNDGLGNDHFGVSVGIFGNLAVIGAHVELNNRGIAYIMNATNGSLVHTLGPSVGVFDLMGLSVSISSTLSAVGVIGIGGSGGSEAGVIRVYDNNTGTLSYTIVNPNNSGDDNDRFGIGVYITDSYLAAAADFEDVSGNANAGIVYVFNPLTQSLLWTFPNPNPLVSAGFGTRLHVHGDLLVVGAQSSDVSSGAAYVYNLTTGLLVHTLVNPNAFGTSDFDRFGSAVVVSDDYVLVGASSEDDAVRTDAGKAYLFDVNTGLLLHTFDYIPDAVYLGTNYRFGASVSMDGNRIVISAAREDNDRGALYVYNYGTWAFESRIANPDLQPGQMGTSLSIDYNTGLMIAGSEFQNRAEVFKLSPVV